MRILVIVPTLNERDNLPTLAPAILGQPVGMELLVVDDASLDGTGRLADEMAAADPRVHVLHRPGRIGIGSAYVTGFQWALDHGYDAVVTMDGDWSHDPSYLPALVEAAGRHDLIVGSRYLHGISVVNWSLARLALSTAANAYVRAIARLPLRDCTSGFQCIHARVLRGIALQHIHSNGYSFLVEVKYRAFRAGFSLEEIPIVFTQRKHGRTKMTRKEILASVLNVWRLRLGYRR